MSIQSGVPWTSESPDDLSADVSDHNNYQEDIDLFYPDELTVAGRAPDADKNIPLDPEDLGITLTPVTPTAIGAVPVPEGTPTVGQGPRVAGTSPSLSWEWGSGGGDAELEAASLVDDVGLWAPIRRHPKPVAPTSVITTFQSGHGWTLTAGTGVGTMTDDTSKFRTGTQSLRVDAGIHASSVTYVTSPTLGATVDLTANYLELMTWAAALTDPLGVFNVEVSSNNGSNWATADTGSRSGLPRSTWSYWRFNKGSFLTLGSVDFAAINRVRVGVRTNTGASSQVQTWLQRLAVCPNATRGKLIIQTEGWQTVYDNAAVFIDRGVMPTVVLRTEAVELQNTAPLMMTIANAKELAYEHGWDLVPSCYAYADQDNASIGQANMEISVLRALHWFRKNGIPNEIGWWIAGGWNTTANGTSAVGEKYANLCATGGSSIANMQPPINPRALRLQHVQGSDGSRITNAQNYITRIADNKGIGVLYWSNMTSGSTSGGTIATSEIATILDSALEADLDVVTSRDLLESVL